VEIVNSFNEPQKQERNNKLFSRLGWWIGTPQCLSGISAFLLILGFDYIKKHYGFDLMSIFGPNAKNIILLSGFATLLSGLVLMPPTLKLLRANYPFMNNLYAAPALGLVFGLVGIFAIKSPDFMVQNKQDATQIAQKINSINTDASVAKTEEMPKIQEVKQEEKIQLRGTYYAR